MLKKPANNHRKIFKKCPKPLGHKISAFYIVDTLFAATGYLTVSDIRRLVYSRYGLTYDRKTIESSINCIYKMRHFSLEQQTVHAGKSRATAFKLVVLDNSILHKFTNNQTNNNNELFR